ncbi:MAG TPA: NTP transferase domain-containing protein [Streptosporangiaceae bacterium]|nr:NTP transferase domain-containing protein [Streptosporangiaceae bacterium]
MSAAGPAAVIVLAAGEGTRMKSPIPKTLHRVCGQTMLGHCLAAAAELTPDRLIVVVGHNGEQVAEHARQQVPGAVIVEQDHLGGTGHAVRVVLETVGTIKGTVVVTYADTPLLQGATLARLCAQRMSADAAAAVLTARAPDPAGYGRIVRDEHGAFAAIVEHADATPEQRAIDEINSGMYAFDGDLLADAVKRVRTDNAQGEEYLTDAVSVLRSDGYPVATVSCDDFEEVQGVNDLAQLARAGQVLNARLLGSMMRAGVRIADPASTWVDVGVDLAAGAWIGPGTQLEGSTTVAAGATVGPGCLLRDTAVGQGATVIQSVCESSVIGDGAHVGPFAHLVKEQVT